MHTLDIHHKGDLLGYGAVYLITLIISLIIKLKKKKPHIYSADFVLPRVFPVSIGGVLLVCVQ